MSLQFIIGRSGSGKSTHFLNNIKHQLIDSPQGPPIIYLVPDQMTFQAEYTLVSTPELEGMIRAQVFSFSRLALRVLQEVGGISRYPLNRVGLTMILRKIVTERQEDLKVFQRSSTQEGFYTYLEQMMTELKRYCISEHELDVKRQRMHTDEQSAQLLQDKLHDVHLIYAQFKQQLHGQYIDAEDMLELLTEKIVDSSFLHNAEILVDGFHQFTPQELEVLRSLMQQAKKVKVALTLDQVYDEQLPNEWDLFHTTAKTYQQVKRLAQEEHIAIESPIVLDSERLVRFQGQPSLAHLEHYFDHRPIRPYTVKPAQPEGVTLAVGVNRRAEVEGVARQIRYLVREQGYRWRDMVILVRGMTPYQDLLETIFEDEQIPVFLDQKRSMLHHPLVECIRSALDVIAHNWQYETVFRCVKTDLLFDWQNEEQLNSLREEFDQLENHVLAYGINGSRWTKPESWPDIQTHDLDRDTSTQTEKDREQQARFEELRQWIVHPLDALQQKLSEAKTVRGKCEQLYIFLEKLNVPHKLDYWRQQAEEEGSLHLAREYDQAWKAVMDLLDQMVEMMGDETISIDMFCQLLDTGCENLRFSLVPPALDQVLVGQMDRSRFTHIRAVFILGANDGILPAKPEEDGLMTEDERSVLTEMGLHLAPSSHEQLAIEQFMIYSSVSSASDQLWLSYALADEEGKSLTPSVLVQQIEQIFPDSEQKLIVNDPYEKVAEEQIDYVTHPQKALSYLVSQLRQWQRGYPLTPFWWDVYNWLMAHEGWRAKSQHVLHSLFYKNEAENLSQETSLALYGQEIRASVSRMERFKSCPFSQFVSNGLRLKERQVFRLEAPDMGQLFHASLKWIAEHLDNTQGDWRELTAEQCRELAREAVHRLSPRLQHNILHSSNRHYYIQHRLQQVIERATKVISEQARSSAFVPVGWEVDFGPESLLPSLRFSLDNGVIMQLVGRIDRVDRAESSQGSLLRVIDYKSSQKALNLNEVYHGLSLQMLTYLDVLVTHSETWLGKQGLPAGVLYFHMHNPMLQTTHRYPQDQIEHELYKKFKMKGLVLAEEEAVRLMDTSLESQYSDIIPVALKKDGGFYSNSSVANAQEFTHLRQYVRGQIKDIGTQMSEGEIGIHPYQLQKKVPCTYCSYKPVCQFDRSLAENDYTRLPNIGSNQVLEHIRHKGGEDHE